MYLCDRAPVKNWLEIRAEYGNRLKRCCEEINNANDVESLCRGFPKRIRKLREEEGRRLKWYACCQTCIQFSFACAAAFYCLFACLQVAEKQQRMITAHCHTQVNHLRSTSDPRAIQSNFERSGLGASSFRLRKWGQASAIQRDHLPLV